MGAGDLAGRDRIVVGHIRTEVVKSVLELDVHPAPKLVDVEPGRGPVDPDLFADSCASSAENPACADMVTSLST